MIYIVTWVLVSVFQVTCPCNKPQIDEYGRWVNQGIYLDVYCTDSRSDTLSKRFYCKSDAEQFINNSPKRDGYIGATGDYITDMKLDSIDAWMED